MNKFVKKKKWLQQLSKVQLKAAIRQKLEREIFYSEYFEEPEIWFSVTVENHNGEKHTMKLLNRQGKRNDSFHIALDDIPVYYNKFDNLVLNQTRSPLILGFSDAMRFMAKQFKRHQSLRVLDNESNI